jgi:hypothetical protein
VPRGALRITGSRRAGRACWDFAKTGALRASSTALVTAAVSHDMKREGRCRLNFSARHTELTVTTRKINTDTRDQPTSATSATDTDRHVVIQNDVQHRMHLVTLATSDGRVAQRSATTTGQMTILSGLDLPEPPPFFDFAVPSQRLTHPTTRPRWQ